jgi:predicted GIY-YIG superfamily endonuclease
VIAQAIEERFMFYVYGLRLKSDSEYRYVGSTNDLRRRMWGHKSGEHRNPEKDAWVEASRSQLTLDILEEVNDGDRLTAEQNWIAKLTNEGHNLFNIRKAHHNTFADLPESRRTDIVTRYLDDFERDTDTPWFKEDSSVYFT